MIDLAITRKSTLKKLKRNYEKQVQNDTGAHDIAFLKAIRPEVRSRCIDLLDLSRAQLRQDLFALTELDFKSGGFFVEFGATNGVDLSNTHLLEKEFQWKGILAEPAQCWHKKLKRNRSAIIETKCVWTKTGETLVFNETPMAELSTIEAFSDSDKHAPARSDGKKYNVDTISLIDLLDQHKAPQRIDYLSIDTEGSEYDILAAFDFDRYDVRVITAEHNKNENRQKVIDLLHKHGFQRKFESVSKFDDWFVKTT